MSHIARRLVPLLLVISGVVAAPAAGQGSVRDTTLAAACAGGFGMAEGLLLIVFRPDVPPATRREAARGVGGRLGPAAENAGVAGEYVILPLDRRLDVAADRLIRLDGVESVGEVQCPPPPAPPAPAPDTAARRDTTAAGDTTTVPGPTPSDTGARRSPAAGDTTTLTPAADTAPPGGP